VHLPTKVTGERRVTDALRILFYVLMALMGALFGSFANVLVWRVPRGESIVSPGSRCPVCAHPIRWFDNVPVISWIALRGRCRDCAAPISARYPVVEALCAGLWLAAAARFGPTPAAIMCAALFFLLLVLTWIDLDTRRLPNIIVATLAGIGLAGVALSEVAGIQLVPLVPLPGSGPAASPAVFALLGALAGAGTSGLLAGAYALVRGRAGLGMGDVKLLGAVGLFTGPYVLLALVLGSIAGAIVGVVGARREGVEVASFMLPFGPFLAGGSVVAVLAGPALWQWYAGVLGIG
jgi:leader peptidase (prepilin peptidase)/N-methyltransferase